MNPEEIIITDEEVDEIYKELDLDEEGITEEEKTRRKRRIFVGGLRYGSEDAVLHEYFVKFGEIKEAVIIRKKDDANSSRGFGFVIMNDDMAALKAVAEKSPKIDGRRCNVNLAHIGQKRKPPTQIVAGESFVNGCIYYGSGSYVYPAGTLLTNTGEPYQLGLPPLHGYQPIYHLPSSPSPTYNYASHSPLTPTPIPPITPYQQMAFFPQHFVFNATPVSDNNNNVSYQLQTTSPVIEINNNSIATINEQEVEINNNGLTLNQKVIPTYTLTPVSTGLGSITSHSLTSENYQECRRDFHQVIINGKTPVNASAIVYNEPISYHPNGNNNGIPSPHVTTVQQNTHGSSNTVCFPNSNQATMVNGNTGHLINGGHLINPHNSVTTYVTSPVPTPSPSIHNAHLHPRVFQFQAANFIQQRNNLCSS